MAGHDGRRLRHRRLPNGKASGYSSGAAGGSGERPSSRPTVARSREGKEEVEIRKEAPTKAETRPPLREKAQRRACQMPDQVGHDRESPGMTCEKAQRLGGL